MDTHTFPDIALVVHPTTSVGTWCLEESGWCRVICLCPYNLAGFQWLIIVELQIYCDIFVLRWCVEDIQIAWWMISLACLFYLAQDGTFIWFISFIGGVPSIFITLSWFQVSIVRLVLSLSHLGSISCIKPATSHVYHGLRCACTHTYRLQCHSRPSLGGLLWPSRFEQWFYRAST